VRGRSRSGRLLAIVAIATLAVTACERVVDLTPDANAPDAGTGGLLDGGGDAGGDGGGGGDALFDAATGGG